MSTPMVSEKISIMISGFITYRKRLGVANRTEIRPGTRLGDLPHLLDLDTDQQRGRLNIMLNGVHSHHLPEHLDTELKDGDEIAIFPPIVGG